MSGPVGDPRMPKDDAVDVAAIEQALAPLEHGLFARRIERSKLRFGDRAIVFALRVDDGDFRDWSAIDARASGIADALLA